MAVRGFVLRTALDSWTRLKLSVIRKTDSSSKSCVLRARSRTVVMDWLSWLSCWVRLPELMLLSCKMMVLRFVWIVVKLFWRFWLRFWFSKKSVWLMLVISEWVTFAALRICVTLSWSVVFGLLVALRMRVRLLKTLMKFCVVDWLNAVKVLLIARTVWLIEVTRVLMVLTVLLMLFTVV